MVAGVGLRDRGVWHTHPVEPLLPGAQGRDIGHGEGHVVETRAALVEAMRDLLVMVAEDDGQPGTTVEDEAEADVVDHDVETHDLDPEATRGRPVADAEGHV